MAKLNWDVVLYNVTDAREQLEEIEQLVQKGDKPSEERLQVMLEHAFHHLSFGWNARYASTKRHAMLSDDDFNAWSKYPKELKPYRVKIAKIK